MKKKLCVRRRDWKVQLKLKCSVGKLNKLDLRVRKWLKWQSVDWKLKLMLKEREMEKVKMRIHYY